MKCSSWSPRSRIKCSILHHDTISHFPSCERSKGETLSAFDQLWPLIVIGSLRDLVSQKVTHWVIPRYTFCTQYVTGFMKNRYVLSSSLCGLIIEYQLNKDLIVICTSLYIYKVSILKLKPPGLEVINGHSPLHGQVERCHTRGRKSPSQLHNITCFSCHWTYFNMFWTWEVWEP